MIAAAWASLLTYLGATLGVLAVDLGLIKMTLGTVRQLLTGLSHAMQQLRDGRYDVAIPGVDRADEIGEMARNTTAFRDDLARIRKDRKSTRLNSSHLGISYAVFCLKKKTYYHER